MFFHVTFRVDRGTRLIKNRFVVVIVIPVVKIERYLSDTLSQKATGNDPLCVLQCVAVYITAQTVRKSETDNVPIMFWKKHQKEMREGRDKPIED